MLWLRDPQHSIEEQRIRERKKKQEVKRNSQEHEAVVRVQERRYRVGGKRIRGLKARMGCKCCISRRGPDQPVEVYQLEESEEEVTLLVSIASPKKAGTQQGGQLQE